MFGLFKRNKKKKTDSLTEEERIKLLSEGPALGIKEEMVELTPEQEAKLKELIEKLNHANKDASK